MRAGRRPPRPLGRCRCSAISAAWSRRQQQLRIAQDLRYGLWAAEFERPDAWRAANPKSVLRLARAQSGDPAERPAHARPTAERRYVNTWGCAIKGNHSQYGKIGGQVLKGRWLNSRVDASGCLV